MYISNFQLQNYKSYQTSEPISLSPGFNLIVGQNNVGKTALLEGLGLSFLSNPYRNQKDVSKARTEDAAYSLAKVSFTISRAELWLILQEMENEFCVPIPDRLSLVKSFGDEHLHIEKHAEKFVRELFSSDYYTVHTGVRTKDPNAAMTFGTDFPAIGDYKAGGTGDKRIFAICSISDENTIVVRSVQMDASADIDFGNSVAQVLRKGIYSFRAERVASARSSAGLEARLESDAGNLARVLGNLHHRPAKLRELNQHLRYVLPHIYEVAVRNVRGQMGLDHEVLVYDDPADQGSAIPLSDSGTGVSQVLAILYVVVASENLQTIIIDEPQSFLHPGAIRKLFEVLNLYPNQYIISTHIPSVIASAKRGNVILVIKERRQESKLKTIDVRDTEHLRLMLHEVGARLGDVFGADYILWVEGATERDCFPLILEKLSPRRLMGTEFVPVLSPDKITGKEADRVIRIHQEISKGKGLLPPAVGFIFDRECREEEIPNLERYANRTVKFIKRRMYENYLLKPMAIEAVLLELGLGKESISAARIQEWLDQEIQKSSYYCPKIKEREPWVKYIDGSKLLSNLFAHFAGSEFPYLSRKVEYGVKITKWLLDSDSDDLKEIAEIIQLLLPVEIKG